MQIFLRKSTTNLHTLLLGNSHKGKHVFIQWQIEYHVLLILQVLRFSRGLGKIRYIVIIKHHYIWFHKFCNPWNHCLDWFMSSYILFYMNAILNIHPVQPTSYQVNCFASSFATPSPSYQYPIVKGEECFYHLLLTIFDLPSKQITKILLCPFIICGIWTELSQVRF